MLCDRLARRPAQARRAGRTDGVSDIEDEREGDDGQEAVRDSFIAGWKPGLRHVRDVELEQANEEENDPGSGKLCAASVRPRREYVSRRTVYIAIQNILWPRKSTTGEYVTGAPTSSRLHSRAVRDPSTRRPNSCAILGTRAPSSKKRVRTSSRLRQPGSSTASRPARGR
jgi:hypothetical protein